MDKFRINNPDSIDLPDNESRRQDDREFLTGLQSEFESARQQLDQVSSRVTHNEAIVTARLQDLAERPPHYQTLRLARYNLDNTVYRLGASVLGGVARPAEIGIPPRLEIRCLGRFEARSEAGLIERWRSAKAKSVLQYLLIKPHEPTHKDTLIEALWPGGNTQSANNNLKAAIHSLRLNLAELSPALAGQPIILFSEGSYRLNPDVDISIDVEEFEKHRATGRRLEKERRLSDAMAEFEKAERLYRGDYLEDEPYEEWTLLKRETLKDNYLIILSKLADYSLKTFSYEDCLAYSQKILTRDPCREDAYRNLMYCHLRLNQKNRALRWFDICCQKIKTELDAAPEKETLELGRSISQLVLGRE